MSNASLDIEAATPEAGVVARPRPEFWLPLAYGLALLACLSVWFLAIRAPLWVDETLSYWQIAGGFKQIWARSIQGNSFAAYAYILWLTRTLFGDKEIVLRIPSILAMLAAVYVFYRCARELFDWDVSLIATMVFILPRGIAFAAIDVRPYGFALLLTNLTILLFLRWTKTHKNAYAALFGAAAAGIVYFHYLFASILLALAVYYFLSRRTALRSDLRQIGIALACFGIFLLPVLPRLKYIYQTRTMHSFADPPQLTWILDLLNPGKGQLFVLAGVILLAIVARQLLPPNHASLDKLAFCVSLALVPILCLYTVSVTTSVHVFIPRYLLVAVPGISLCWGWLCSRLASRPLRGLFCFAFVALCVSQAYRSPLSRWHEDSWKGSLAFADANAAQDNAPILMCSPLVEADYEPMPAVASDSVLYAPLSYYKVNARVVPLPRTLNAEAQRQVSHFLMGNEGTRFLVLVPLQSRQILALLAASTQGTHSYRVLGESDNIFVLEFTPYAVGPS
ncbi:MAG: glycosyltransferase family 39 protein [Candidatus Korobacteraceae bacterium]